MNRQDLIPVLKQITPPVLWDVLRRLHGRTGQIYFRGDYENWDAAVRESGGYDAETILTATRAAMRKIRDGQAVFERDSVLLDQPEPPFPLICGLLRAATLSGNRLSVLDFGGALGSTYFQCRPFLDGLTSLRWSVVEQPGHVACGRAEFANDVLRFYPDVEECCGVEKPDVLILSCVLQYLPAPYNYLQHLLQLDFPHVILDRTAFWNEDRDRLTIQHVPGSIYQASYPAWFFSKTRLLRCFSPRYVLIQGFPGADRVALERGSSDYQGFIFEKTGA